MSGIVKQRLARLTYKGERIFIEDQSLNEVSLSPGSSYGTSVEVENNKIIIFPDNTGNKVSSKTKILKTGAVKVIPIIDKKGNEIKKALSNCTSISITFLKDASGDRVEIVGIKPTASVLREIASGECPKTLTAISFFSGAGIGSSCFKRSGFVEKAACEYNPCGNEEQFAEVYQVNHPDSVMYNVPIGMLSADILPKAHLWITTPCCNDYSSYSSSKQDYDSIHQFMYIMKLFWGMKREDRPLVIFTENVPQFKNVAGNSLSNCFKDEGYYVKDMVLNSLDYGSRTERKRYYLVASVYDGFEFPEPTGRKETPIIEDGIITLDNLEWVTPENDATLKYFIERNDVITHNHKISAIDITKDKYFGTFPKNHHKKIPTNLVRHPEKENTFAFVFDEKALKYLHGIDDEYYLGECKKTIIESIGQGVDCHTLNAIAQNIYDFLWEKIYGIKEEYRDLPLVQYMISGL